MAKKEIITTKKAPAPLGPYSEAVKVGDFVFVSGQKGLDLSGSIVPGGIEAETRQTLENIKAILEAAGSSLSEVVMTTVFITDMSEFAKMNGVYGQYFTEAPPARSTVEVSQIPGGGKVEISVIAVSK